MGAEAAAPCLNLLVRVDVQRKGGREEIILSVNTPGSIKYCGSEDELKSRTQTSALCRTAIIIKYYSVKKMFQPRVPEPELICVSSNVDILGRKAAYCIPAS